ncbi:homoserine O-succinyltransferase [Pseudoalteromonas sp. 2CM41L]|uniref:homoserine O-acetyltransferase/O-succinyltransferase family protein n=1 Tax=Pseudoalteromonas sp. 2CM41L TaxID=2929857 RepID=UPI0020BE9BFF|nr:homoserine O-succinyltransferase [Pseudoalteromonas sp. 2CM41L]MCK8109051.1 homoserine O-succinyltransferase [Pseudoalteromonas sp. 2CM41L]
MSVVVINLMPDIQTYEREMREALYESGVSKDSIKWAKLRTKVYREKGSESLPSYYSYIDELFETDVQINTVIVTGAPVEHLEFNEIQYWVELRNVITHCLSKKIKLLGICWGALAVAQVIGIKKANLDKKVFGVYQQKITKSNSGLFEPHDYLLSPFSIAAIFSESCVSRAQSEQKITVHATSSEVGPSLVSAQNGNVLMSLGHFEYAPERLKNEWIRDTEKGKELQSLPENYCIQTHSPCWKEDSKNFFGSWLRQEQSSIIEH